MAKILKFPDGPMSWNNAIMSGYQIDMLINAHKDVSFRYGLSVGLVCGAAFTFLGFVLAFIFR